MKVLHIKKGLSLDKEEGIMNNEKICRPGLSASSLIYELNKLIPFKDDKMNGCEVIASGVELMKININRVTAL